MKELYEIMERCGCTDECRTMAFYDAGLLKTGVCHWRSQDMPNEEQVLWMTDRDRYHAAVDPLEQRIVADHALWDRGLTWEVDDEEAERARLKAV